jgi:hypothetical protein
MKGIRQGRKGRKAEGRNARRKVEGRKVGR